MTSKERHGSRVDALISHPTVRTSRDWVGNLRSYGLVWGLPLGAMLAGMLVDVPIRTFIWTAALAWMGTACLLNARRCGRTHCRFTGPFYLAMIIPVLALGSGIVSGGPSAWLVLGALIVLGSKGIWWATERAWGKFS
jgi:hypothetical protein